MSAKLVCTVTQASADSSTSPLVSCHKAPCCFGDGKRGKLVSSVSSLRELAVILAIVSLAAAASRMTSFPLCSIVNAFQNKLCLFTCICSLALSVSLQTVTVMFSLALKISNTQARSSWKPGKSCSVKEEKAAWRQSFVTPKPSSTKLSPLQKSTTTFTMMFLISSLPLTSLSFSSLLSGDPILMNLLSWSHRFSSIACCKNNEATDSSTLEAMAMPASRTASTASRNCPAVLASSPGPGATQATSSFSKAMSLCALFNFSRMSMPLVSSFPPV